MQDYRFLTRKMLLDQKFARAKNDEEIKKLNKEYRLFYQSVPEDKIDWIDDMNARHSKRINYMILKRIFEVLVSYYVDVIIFLSLISVLILSRILTGKWPPIPRAGGLEIG